MKTSEAIALCASYLFMAFIIGLTTILVWNGGSYLWLLLLLLIGLGFPNTLLQAGSDIGNIGDYNDEHQTDNKEAIIDKTKKGINPIDNPFV